MNIINLRELTVKHIGSSDRQGAGINVDNFANNLTLIFKTIYPSNHYAVANASIGGWDGVDDATLHDLIESMLVDSIYCGELYLLVGLRSAIPTKQYRCFMLLDEELDAGEYNTQDYTRVLMMCYDGVAYFDVVTDSKSIDDFFAEYYRISLA